MQEQQAWIVPFGTNHSIVFIYFDLFWFIRGDDFLLISNPDEEGFVVTVQRQAKWKQITKKQQEISIRLQLVRPD